MEQATRITAGLFVAIYVARYLGPNQFGVYNYSLAFVAIFGSVAKLGLDSILVRDLVDHPEQRDVYLGTAFWLKLAAALFALTLVTITAQFSGNNTTTNLYIFIIACGLIFQAFEVVNFYFQSKLLSKHVTVAKFIQLGLSSALKLYLVFIESDLFWFVLVSLIDQISLGLALAHAYSRQGIGNFFGSFSLTTAKAMLRNSWALMLSSIAVTIYIRIDQIMIKEMLGDREVGLYSAATRLTEALYFVPVTLTASLFPAIVNAKKESQVLFGKIVQRLCTVLVWLAIVIALSLTFLSDPIVGLLYGLNYTQSSSVLAIHAWGLVFVSLGVVTEYYFITENYTKKSLPRTVLGAISNILLNLVMIPRFGIHGAAMATVLSLFIANYIFDLLDNSTRQLFIIKTKALFAMFSAERKLKDEI